MEVRSCKRRTRRGTRDARHRLMTTPSKDRQRWTETYGLGQSGYTAGRHTDDPALERVSEPRNRGYPPGTDDRLLELGDDERWIGRGGSPWYPVGASDAKASGSPGHGQQDEPPRRAEGGRSTNGRELNMGERDKPRSLEHACRQRTWRCGEPCVRSSIRNASRRQWMDVRLQSVRS